ncbi:phosphotransferase enzyme family protein [Roseibium sp.]|uniref:phosphotransferase enzyme family protein n=1 Tax=Roseibium sp. TaxID=1936156 RepID=UPI003BA8F6C2
MDEAISELLALWGVQTAESTLVAARENRVFRVNDGSRTLALRLHRPGLRSSVELRSELAWMAELGRNGISVPYPVASDNGEFLREVNGQQASMLAWMSGSPLGRTGQPLELPDRKGTFFKLGRLMARLHDVSDRWTPPDWFQRVNWDADALAGPDPLWGRFWENPDLDPAECALLLRFRDTARGRLKELERGLDKGLIHADLVRENVMIEGPDLHLIDFDDAGCGYRLFDIATALIKNRQEPDYRDLRDAFLSGYLKGRPMDFSALDLFLCLRAVSYVGWIIARLDENGGRMRSKRMIADATKLVEGYLSSSRHSSILQGEVSP